MPETQLADWIEQTRAGHERRFQELLEHFAFGKVNHRVHFIQGEAGEVIARVAADEKIDLIVMGTLARTGIEGYFIGNTAETVLQRVECSVLTTKPDGFVSPVGGGG